MLVVATEWEAFLLLIEQILCLSGPNGSACASLLFTHSLQINAVIDLELCQKAFHISSSSLPTIYTGLFMSPSGISELDCATTRTDTAERSISIGRESLQVSFVLGALAYFQVPLRGSREEKWRSQ